MKPTDANEMAVKRIRHAELDAKMCGRDFPSVKTKDVATLLELYDAERKRVDHLTHEKRELESEIRELN